MASGKPDYKDDSIISGKFGVTFIPVGVDAAGNMLGIMQGLGPGGLAPIALDAAGRMIANLGAQDLDRIVIRTSLGVPVRANLNHVFMGIGTFDVLDIAGKGQILGGYLWHDTPVSHDPCGLTMEIDGVVFGSTNFRILHDRGITQKFMHSFYLGYFDDTTNFRYNLGFSPGWTFDSSIKITLLENVGAAQFDGFLYYTLA